jgi:hypothetical protein
MMTFAWDDAFHELWMHAARTRGTATSLGELPGVMRYSTMQAWPRTRGSDVLAIAAVVDPVLRALPMQPGGYGIERLWHACVIDLEWFALDHVTREYVHNRAFWSTLAATMAYLATIEAPFPAAATWRALLAEFANPGEHRNGPERDDKLHVTAKTYDELWNAQKAALVKLRGADVRETPAGVMGGAMAVPRTTNADVLQLATYWTDALTKLEIKRFLGGVVNAMGLDGEKQRWQAALADVDRYAKTGTPGDIYPKNHEFWRASGTLSITVAAIDGEPAPFDLMVDSFKQAVKDLPGRIAGAAGAVAHAIGNIAHEAGAGLFSGFGTPLLVGGGVLVGLFLLLRSRGHREDA